MSLIEPQQFAPVFEPLRGLRVGFLPMPGNVGDRLIDLGVIQLFDHFGIAYRTIPANRLSWGGLDQEFDTIVVSGGGNLGRRYDEPVALREAAQKQSLPIVILPQSMAELDEDLDAYQTIYARERYTQALDPRFQLAPDLALAVSANFNFESAIAPLGIFLRTNQEARFAEDSRSIIDPVLPCETVHDYLKLASQFEHIVTDRLHFAVAALTAGRRATLLPNSYHKNLGMYEAWLADLGCEWCDDPARFDFDPASLKKRLPHLVTTPPSKRIPDRCIVHVAEHVTSQSTSDGRTVVLDQDFHGITGLTGADKAVWQLLSNNPSIVDIANEIQEQHPTVDRGRLAAMIRYFGYKEICTLEDPACARDPMITRGSNWLTLNPPIRNGDTLRVSAMFYQGHLHQTRELWFETASENHDLLSERVDPFVLGVLHRCMVEGRDLWVRGGTVSHDLLQNLDDYQAVWHCWDPSLNLIRIHATQLDKAKPVNNKAISCFSGGLDSTHTVFRERELRLTPRNHTLEAALMVQGFDIPFEDVATWRESLVRANRIMEQLDIPLLQLKTNVRTFNTDWPSAHGLAAASCLSLFSEGFGAGLIPSTFAYNALVPWGSNPVSDQFMGSDRFQIEHNSADRNRFEKIAELVDRPDVIRQLRVCWQEGSRATNCGRCIKCVMTGLMAITAGASADFLGEGFSEEAACEALAIDTIARADWMDAQLLFREASKRDIRAPWVAALAKLRPM